jgi:hypothetical protein
VKHEVTSFLIKNVKPRNVVARNMLDRNGPYRERIVHPKKIAQNRRPKNAREAFGEWEE